ncbi:MAG: ABC transporter substrate-binding protein [Desulfobacterales bacterium]|nr:MAG: ABC transporter substrate-binding protein [Desulfobacterales bacterium]
MRNTAFFLLLIIAGVPASSFAQQPIEALQRGIEKGISVLENPQFEDASRKQEQQQKLWEIMLQVFDFKEFSRRVLGSHWHKFSQQQRDDFVRTFSTFLGKFYLGRLQDRYNNQKVIYLGQQIISDSRALVEVEVLWKNMKVPVELRMTNLSGSWKVYDLTVLGINAVNNYRAQFKSILSKETPQQIIARIEDKIAELDEKS